MSFGVSVRAFRAKCLGAGGRIGERSKIHGVAGKGTTAPPHGRFRGAHYRRYPRAVLFALVGPTSGRSPGPNILRLEKELYEIRNRIGVTANEIGTIQQEFIVSNMNGSGLSGTVVGPKASGEQVRNLVYNAYFRDHLSAADYRSSCSRRSRRRRCRSADRSLHVELCPSGLFGRRNTPLRPIGSRPTRFTRACRSCAR